LGPKIKAVSRDWDTAFINPASPDAGFSCAYVLIAVSESTDKAQGQEENQAPDGAAKDKGYDDAHHRRVPSDT
jgi:hypothetical protein